MKFVRIDEKAMMFEAPKSWREDLHRELSNITFIQPPLSNRTMRLTQQ